MDKGLLWTAFGLGVFGVLYGFGVGFRARPSEPREVNSGVRPYGIAGIGILILLFLLSMLKQKPYTEGFLLGKSSLCGGVGAFLAYGVMARVCAVHRQAEASSLRLLSLLTPLLHVGLLLSIAMLWFRVSLYDGLMGLVIGWSAVTLPLMVALLQGKPEGRRFLLPLLMGLGYLFTFACSLSIAEDRAHIVLKGGAVWVSWGTLLLLLGTALPVFLLVCTLLHTLFLRVFAQSKATQIAPKLFGRLFQSDDAPYVAARMIEVLLSSVLLFGLSRWLQGRLNADKEFSLLVLLGLGAGFLIWWLHADLLHREPKAVPIWQNSLLSVLILIGTMMYAYQWTHNTGVGMALMGIWLPLSFAILTSITTVDEEREYSTPTLSIALLRMLLFGTVVYAYQFYDFRYSVDSSYFSSLNEHYRLYSFVIGAALPLLLTQWLWREKPTVLRTLLSGGVAVAIPALLILLFRAEVGVWMFWGGAFSILFSDSGFSKQSAEESERRLPSEVVLLPALYGMISLIVLNEWVDYILQFANIEKAKRIRAISYILGGILALVLASDYVTRWKERRNGSSENGGN